MKKLLSLLGVGVLAAMWSGCGVTDPAGPPKITIDPAIGSITIGTNDVTKNVLGKIEADTAISSITATVETKAGVAVPTSQISITTPAGNGEKTQNLTSASCIVLTIKSAAQPGDYKLVITAVAGPSTTVKYDFTLTGNPGTDITTASVELGSYDNPNKGSSVDLDAASPGPVLAAAATGSADIDLVGTYSPSKSALRLFSPVYARDSSKITAFGTWPNAAATTIVKVSGTAFSAITKVEQIQPLYAAGTAVTAVSCAKGDVFVVKTSAGKYVAIEVGDFTANATGTFTIKYGK